MGEGLREFLKFFGIGWGKKQSTGQEPPPTHDMMTPEAVEESLRLRKGFGDFPPERGEFPAPGDIRRAFPGKGVYDLGESPGAAIMGIVPGYDIELLPEGGSTKKYRWLGEPPEEEIPFGEDFPPGVETTPEDPHRRLIVDAIDKLRQMDFAVAKAGKEEVL